MDENEIRLDEDYKAGLKLIKQVILNSKNPDNVSSCGLWLQRLEACGPGEKYLRNQYLSELCRQLKEGELCEPFLSPPPPIFLDDELADSDGGSWSDASTISTTEITGSGDTRGLMNPLHADEDESTGLQTLATDVEYLKGRLKDLIRVKRKLQNSHDAAVAQWERRAKLLEDRLNMVLTDNEKLRSSVAQLEESLRNQEIEKENDCQEAHKREMDEFRNRQFQLLKHLEDKHALELKRKDAETTAKLDEMKLIYETRIAALTASNEDSLNSLTAEKEKLEVLIKEERNRNEQEVIFIKTGVEQEKNEKNEVLENKVVHLQNCVEKMETLLRKYEKHYTKKIDTLKKELRGKDNMLQIQLAAQRAELLARASSEKHADVENVVSQLENRYRELLDDQHARVLQTGQEHSDIIQQLSYKLESL